MQHDIADVRVPDLDNKIKHGQGRCRYPTVKKYDAGGELEVVRLRCQIGQIGGTLK
jgi:hypothetical protein